MIGLPEEALAAKYVIKTHYVAQVIKFYPEDQTVDVVQATFEFATSPMGDMVMKNEFGQEIVVRLMKPDIIHHIPVKQLRWGQFEIQACPKPGDTGYIEIFTDDISSWRENGEISVPWSDRHFAKENCVFVPFVANAKNASEDYVATENELVIKSRTAKIKITDNGTTSDISLIADTLSAVATSGVTIDGDVSITGNITATGDIESSTGDVKTSTTSLNSHAHSGVTTGPGTSGGPVPLPGV